MKRGRQLELSLRRRARQGKRMGRPRSRRGVAHERRKGFSSLRALLVTVRMAPGIRLRNRKMYRVLRDVFCKTCRQKRFRIVHYVVEGNHIHMIVEAGNRAEMTRGMRAVNIRIGLQVNRALGRATGTVVADRYDERHLTSPRRARHGLAYVVNNHRHHLAERGHIQPPLFWVDPFSSAPYFSYRNQDGCPAKEGDPIAPPKGWMLRLGWQRAGPSIPTDFVPATVRPPA